MRPSLYQKYDKKLVDMTTLPPFFPLTLKRLFMYLLYTANVLSAEITDECLQTKSKDNLQ